MENQEFLEKAFSLDFAFTLAEEERWRIVKFKEKAREIIECFLKGKSLGLAADTGTGKTDIAFLSVVPFILWKNFRVLFLTPQRGLTLQQYEAFLLITEAYKIKAEIITGRIPKKKRSWNNPETGIVFATPQTISGNEEIVKHFNIVIFDEFHHGTGGYDYVPISANAKKNQILRFGLSASPGTTKEEIGQILNNMSLDTVIRFEIKMHLKFEDNIEVEMDEPLKKIDECFVSLLKETEEEMKKNQLRFLKQKKWRPFSEKELFEFEKEVKTWKDLFDEYFVMVFLLAKYRKLRHSYFVCMTEGYKTFLEYVKKLERDSSKAADNILNHGQFKKIIEISQKNYHPKAGAFKKFMEKFPENGTALIFVGQKDTGRIILEYMKSKNMDADYVFGGSDKDEKRQKEKLKMLKERSIHFLVSSSVLYEGVHIPDINYVINYSIPRATINRIQSKGRSGRTMPGHVVNLFLNHPFFDKGTLFSTLRGEKNMKELLDPSRVTRKKERADQIGIAF